MNTKQTLAIQLSALSREFGSLKAIDDLSIL